MPVSDVMADSLLSEQDVRKGCPWLMPIRWQNALATPLQSMSLIETESIYASKLVEVCARPIELQLKATVSLGDPLDGCYRFRLKVRNYDLLRIETQTPRLLVVLDLPCDENDWVTINEDELILRRRAYWVNLKGYEETTNRTSVTVSIPKGNVFNVESLRDLMDQSRRGRIQ